MMKLFILLSLDVSHCLRLSKHEKPAGAPAAAPAWMETWVQKEIDAGYPTLSKIANKIDAWEMKTTGDACDADFNIQMLGSGYPRSGFGSIVNNMMNQLALAAYGNFSATLPGNGHLMTEWKNFFQPTVPVCAKIAQGHRQQSLNSTNSHFAAVLLQGLTKQNHAFVSDFKRAMYQKYFRLNEQSKDRITKDLAKMGLSPGTKYIGVHIRHGDKLLEAAPISDETYSDTIVHSNKTSLNKDLETDWSEEEVKVYYGSMAEKVQTIIELQAGLKDVRTIYLASDDPQASIVLTKLLGNDYTVKTADTQSLTKSVGAAYNGFDRLITDVEALQRSTAFIGTATSNIGRLVYFQRGKEEKSLSLDDGGDFLATVQ